MDDGWMLAVALIPPLLFFIWVGIIRDWKDM